MTKPYFLLIAILLTVNCIAQNPTSADLKKKQADIQNEIDDLRKSLDETKKYKKESLGQLALIQKKLRLREQQVALVNQQINSIQGTINQNWREIVKLRGELDTLKIQYEKSVVYAYKNRSNYDFLNFLFSASSFNDALKRVAYLKSYRAYREQQAENYRTTQELLQQKISNLNDNKKQKNEALEEQTKQRAVLEEDKKEQDVVVNKLKTREKELNKDMNDKRKQDIALRNAINAAIRREIDAARKKAMAEEAAAKKAAEAKRLADAEAAKKAADIAKANNASKNNAPTTTANPPATNNAATTVPATTAPVKPKPSNNYNSLDREETKAMSESFEKNKGNLPWPMSSGVVVMHFGKQNYGGLVTYDNPGITIEAGTGSTVKAVFDGEVLAVTSVGPVEAVIIQHGKYITSYSNLSSTSVSKGQTIKMGQVIGKLAEKDDNRGELEFLITNVISNERSVNLDPEKWLR
ncbi:murein hydrolase activator EnvC family protein [Pinibacter soli]|uniref:Peptidoglycan DD-metalloendopeptidase family protein n=1 Tax=Pinibacter soli TaxID=3044211 RepID=A0ABT6R8J3_9BACT|nr:peptidoglycan DD-metalloendopeptidase family protein [Pinibacter soli]MDI3318873.1 peptidoglycan DD-metalloendopeptidase family protein [Pinibacter soli]